MNKVTRSYQLTRSQRAIFWLVLLPSATLAHIAAWLYNEGGSISDFLWHCGEKICPYPIWRLMHDDFLPGTVEQSAINAAARRAALAVGMVGVGLLFVVAGALALPHADEYARSLSEWARAAVSGWR